MNEYLDPSNKSFNADELDLEKKLRPLSFDDFTGQEQVLENLKIFVEAANQREEALDHTLFHGPPGLGKTTLANILANELGVSSFQGNLLDVRDRYLKAAEKSKADFIIRIPADNPMPDANEIASGYCN